ncbi:HK97 gp10 family phage protein [Weissella paramesenteroides]|uniref:HK97 gp10 family phage protein n=1 Tax=Weissella paramesenteroides TaxID=1249 RepID=UPI0013DD5305|nr:HK97 gp10 family phage protein [Weissella paramesenteroides]NEZ89931.1 HK97 gp10 family phage protein [Weissella paramesenteroides]NFB04344.1 HK97 gp10 family phage protein [Weissella paramesenteroides]
MAEQSFEAFFEDFLKQAEDLTVNLPVEDKVKVTKAGAQVFAKELEDVYKQKHYRHRKTGEDPHLADSVIMQNTNIDGMKDGSSTVGFNQEKAYIANFIENGTKFPMYTKRGHRYKHAGQVNIIADHVIANLRANPNVQAKMLKAEAKAYNKILEKKGDN